METALQDIAGPPPTDGEEGLRLPPPPRSGGLIVLLRFMGRHRMLTAKYLRLILRLGRRRFLTPYGRRIKLDGLAFIGPKVVLQIGRNARVELRRWAWVGHGSKIRCHEGVVSIGAKTVLGQECTISAYQHVSIGRECVIADRVMLIDFDHGMVEVERPIREQGIYKRDVRVGNNVWIGYGASFLRGVTVGDNAVVGTYTVVNKDVAANSVVAGVPVRVLRMRGTPRQLRWEGRGPTGAPSGPPPPVPCVSSSAAAATSARCASAPSPSPRRARWPRCCSTAPTSHPPTAPGGARWRVACASCRW